MKKIKFLIIFIVLGSCSNLKYLDEFDGNKNKPSKVKSTTYSVNYTDGLIREDMAFGFIHLYDSKGRRLKRRDFKSDGSYNFGGRTYKYDKYGNRIQETIYKKDGTIHLQTNHKYNKFGQEIEIEKIRNGKKTTTKYFYGREHKVKKIICKTSDSIFSKKIVHRYNEEWRETEIISYDSNCRQKSRIELIYDKEGNNTKSKWYNSKNEFYEYNNLIYNLNKDIIRTEKYRIKKRIPVLTKVIELKYKYDENGNWIEKSIIPNSQTSYITKRTFKYVW